MRKLIISASPASGLNCGKENENKCVIAALPLSLSKGEHDNHITAHTNKCNLVTGYGLLCSRLYILKYNKL